MKTKDIVYEELVVNRDIYLSGAALAKKLGITRTAVWQAINLLRGEGHVIDAITNHGYKLMDGDEISAAKIVGYLPRHVKPYTDARNIRIYYSLSSTNDKIRDIISWEDNTSAVVLTTCQTEGRGRRGRTFYSPHGGLYMSLAAKPPKDFAEIHLITACTAVAVCEAVSEIAGFQPEIKWVNDLMYNGKKLCGILTEASLSVETKDLNFLVIGIGINVKPLDECGVPSEVANIAAALDDFSKTPVDKNLLAAKILEKFSMRIRQLNSREFLKYYREHSCVIGKKVTVIKSDENLCATVLGIGDDAALEVEYSSGVRERINTGEISLRLE